ncbi:alanine racemase [Roseovarius pacificus]|uniref:Alanine racemase n=1 Tax=Roseovarius pacificus TaxID=337701 RepID=A0A1M6XDF8_9RHOB|nr:alanine racemase [Roseovarius pacificus]GGO52271.1 alanine racemase [Roseovarius pacificus]SHL03958.1 alanine racemase [Roseovarius pacificus]
MSTATLTIDLDAICANWRALDGQSTGETAAVVKADAYGLGADRAARALARAGARTFFVAVAEEGAALREALGPGPVINVFSGHMPGDADMIGDMDLVPMLNSLDQMIRHVEALPGRPFGVQLDSGMNRLGMEPAEWAATREVALGQSPTLLMSHLACADEPDHPMNRQQLDCFRDMTADTGVPLCFANTGGVLLGPDYHFDMTRPGIGLYGGRPFEEARPVVTLDLPVIQCRDLEPGETVGYANSFTAQRPTRIATVAAGYADGIHRAMAATTHMLAEGTPCPLAGRISMDLISVDVTDLGYDPKSLQLLGPEQGVDVLADNAGTIGYEILTALGPRYARRYLGG